MLITLIQQGSVNYAENRRPESFLGRLEEEIFMSDSDDYLDYTLSL